MENRNSVQCALIQTQLLLHITHTCIQMIQACILITCIKSRSLFWATKEIHEQVNRASEHWRAYLLFPESRKGKRQK